MIFQYQRRRENANLYWIWREKIRQKKLLDLERLKLRYSQKQGPQKVPIFADSTFFEHLWSPPNIEISLVLLKTIRPYAPSRIGYGIFDLFSPGFPKLETHNWALKSSKAKNGYPYRFWVDASKIWQSPFPKSESVWKNFWLTVKNTFDRGSWNHERNFWAFFEHAQK